MIGIIIVSFCKNRPEFANIYVYRRKDVSNLIWLLATLATVIFKIFLAFGIISKGAFTYAVRFLGK